MLDSHPESQPVRFGIIGCGIIASVHAKGIENTENAELAAVYDYVNDKAVQFAETYPADVCNSYEELLSRPDIDVVCICTPSGMHAEQTILAANAGKHILVEKPMAIKLGDIDRMIQVCQEKGVMLSTVFPRRMSPQAHFARELIREGRLGRLSLCSAYVKIYRDQSYYDSAGWRGTWDMDGGGAMMNQGIHTVDMLQWLAGPVTSLYAKAKAVLRAIEVEDTVVVMLQFESGALGVLEITTTAFNGKGQRLELHGEKGTLVMAEDSIVSLDVQGENITLPEFEAFRVVPDGHQMQIEDMVKAVRGEKGPMITGEDARHSLEIILGAYESSDHQREMALMEPRTGQIVL